MLDTWKPEIDFVSIMGELVLVVIQYFYWKAQTILLIGNALRLFCLFFLGQHRELNNSNLMFLIYKDSAIEL